MHMSRKETCNAERDKAGTKRKLSHSATVSFVDFHAIKKPRNFRPRMTHRMNLHFFSLVRQHLDVFWWQDETWKCRDLEIEREKSRKKKREREIGSEEKMRKSRSEREKRQDPQLIWIG
jgi:hypothetical protein